MKTLICTVLVLLGLSAEAAIYQNQFTSNASPAIVGAGAATVTSNNAGIYTITVPGGSATNAVTSTNGNQFLGVPLSIKSGASLTNTVTTNGIELKPTVYGGLAVGVALDGAGSFAQEIGRPDSSTYADIWFKTGPGFTNAFEVGFRGGQNDFYLFGPNGSIMDIDTGGHTELRVGGSTYKDNVLALKNDSGGFPAISFQSTNGAIPTAYTEHLAIGVGNTNANTAFANTVFLGFGRTVGTIPTNATDSRRFYLQQYNEFQGVLHNYYPFAINTNGTVQFFATKSGAHSTGSSDPWTNAANLTLVGDGSAVIISNGSTANLILGSLATASSLSNNAGVFSIRGSNAAPQLTINGGNGLVSVTKLAAIAGGNATDANGSLYATNSTGIAASGSGIPVLDGTGTNLSASYFTGVTNAPFVARNTNGVPMWWVLTNRSGVVGFAQGTSTVNSAQQIYDPATGRYQILVSNNAPVLTILGGVSMGLGTTNPQGIGFDVPSTIWAGTLQSTNENVINTITGATVTATSGNFTGTATGATMRAASGQFSGTLTGATVIATSGQITGTSTQGIMQATTANVSGTLTGATVTATSGNFSGTVTGATANVTTVNSGSLNNSGTITGATVTVTSGNVSGTLTGATVTATSGNFSGTVTGSVAQAAWMNPVGNNAAVYLRAGDSNNVTLTNILGVSHKTSASVIELNANVSANFNITNRVTAATTLVFTNTTDGQTISAFVLGEASGGSARVITLVPHLGNLVASEDAFGVALALSGSFTLTNGNAAEVSWAVRKLNGTNIAAMITRQFAF